MVEPADPNPFTPPPLGSLPTSSEEQYWAMVRRGRAIVAVMILLSFCLSASGALLVTLLVGPEQIPQRIVRITVRGALFVFLWRGHRWARILVLILLGSDVLCGAFLTVLIEPVVPDAFGLVGLFVLIAVSATFAGVLLGSESVRIFLDSQAMNRSTRRDEYQPGKMAALLRHQSRRENVD